MKILNSKYGTAVLADFHDWISETDVRGIPLVIADPWYGNICKDKRDRFSNAKIVAEEQSEQLMLLQNICCSGAACYWYGGYGKPHFRPFYMVITLTENCTKWEMAMHITWSKKRAYGVQNNYLSTREEIAYFVLGDANKPRMFYIPLLNEERGYAGYNKKYPAKSKYKRRTAVWTDVTEILRGKVNECQKPERLSEIMIETHTNPGEIVLDLFAGSFSASLASMKLGRQFIAVESDEETFDFGVSRLQENGVKFE